MKRVLMVCTGNIFRSPMAVALLRWHLYRMAHQQDAGVEVKSAGTAVVDSRPTPVTLTLMREYGIDLSSHRATQLDARLTEWADLILVMTSEHKDYIKHHFPRAARKTLLISEFAGELGEVPEPAQRSMSLYRECAQRLYTLTAKIAESVLYRDEASAGKIINQRE